MSKEKFEIKPPLQTLDQVRGYIKDHEKAFGYGPYAIGLEYDDYINILHECAADGRCNNVHAHVGNVKLVRL